MATCFLAPIGNGMQFFTSQGVVLAGGKIQTYTAGTTTPQATFSDSTGATPLANPIILGSDGRVSGEIWLTQGVSYKFLLQDSTGATIKTYDNLAGINDATISQSEWVVGPTPTFIGATQFSVAGDQRATYEINRRVKASVTAGTIYGNITAATFGASVTTVTVAWDAAASLDSGLSALSYSLFDATHTSTPPFVDASVVAQNNSDNTKTLKLDLSAITTATQRTLFMQDSNIYLKSPVLQVFTANGTYTPTVGMRVCKVTCVGSGAGGGGVVATGAATNSVGGGGGPGQVVIGLLTAAQIGASKAVTIGAAGAGGIGATGGSGATSSVGTLITAAGGVGGEASSASGTVQANGGVGGSGGTVPSGGLSIAGCNGGDGIGSQAGLNIIGGAGGSTMFGGGGSSRMNTTSTPNVNGRAATGYGAGGGGAIAGNNGGTGTGGAGGGGIVLIEEYF